MQKTGFQKTGQGPFESLTAARDAIIQNPKLNEVPVHYGEKLRMLKRIPENSIAYDHPPQTEHLRVSGKDGDGKLVKCGLTIT